MASAKDRAGESPLNQADDSVQGSFLDAIFLKKITNTQKQLLGLLEGNFHTSSTKRKAPTNPHNLGSHLKLLPGQRTPEADTEAQHQSKSNVQYRLLCNAQQVVAVHAKGMAYIKEHVKHANQKRRCPLDRVQRPGPGGLRLRNLKEDPAGSTASKAKGKVGDADA